MCIFVCICVQSLLLLCCRQGMCHRFSPFCIVGCVCVFFWGGVGGGGMVRQQKMAGESKKPQRTPFPSVCHRSVQQLFGLSFAGGR